MNNYTVYNRSDHVAGNVNAALRAGMVVQKFMPSSEDITQLYDGITARHTLKTPTPYEGRLH